MQKRLPSRVDCPREQNSGAAVRRTARSRSSCYFYGVTVYDHDGAIVTIEPDMLAGRDIGAHEEAAIRSAIEQLTGFIGTPHTQPPSTNAVDPIAQPSGTPTPRAEKSSSSSSTFHVPPSANNRRGGD